MNFILNEILVNQRHKILEFGSGISTILIARVLKNKVPDGVIYSIENDLGWCNYLQNKIEEEGLNQHVVLIYSPLIPKDLYGKTYPWYDPEILGEKININKSFDCLIVDGPMAFLKDNIFSRYFAVPYAIDKLSDNFVIFIDDAARKGEKFAIKEYTKKYNLSFNTFYDTVAVSYKGAHFVSCPL